MESGSGNDEVPGTWVPLDSLRSGGELPSRGVSMLLLLTRGDSSFSDLIPKIMFLEDLDIPIYIQSWIAGIILSKLRRENHNAGSDRQTGYSVLALVECMPIILLIVRTHEVDKFIAPSNEILFCNFNIWIPF